MDRTNSNPPNADDIKALTQVVSTALKGKINVRTTKKKIKKKIGDMMIHDIGDQYIIKIDNIDDD